MGAGIGGQAMGGPMSAPESAREHYLSNMAISIPHRKPLSDEFGSTKMSSLMLMSEEEETVHSGQSGYGQRDAMLVLSANEVALRLSKMLCRISKGTVQMTCDIPSRVLSAPIVNRNRGWNQRAVCEDNSASMVHQIERRVMES